MKKAIKLVLVYILMQLLALLTVIPIDLLIQFFVQHKPITADTTLSSWTTLTVMFLGFAYMALYLCQKHYLDDDGRIYSPTSPTFLLLSLLAGLSAIYLVDLLTSFLSFLPDINASTFSLLESSLLGVLCLVIAGPIIEELLFRGAITRELLRRYSPRVAIIWSAVLFGVAHINPTQVVPAVLIGLLLAWVFVKTRSLIPGILIHIVNNALSVGLGILYPEADSLTGLLSPVWMWAGAVIAIVVLVVTLRKIARYRTPDLAL